MPEQLELTDWDKHIYRVCDSPDCLRERLVEFACESGRLLRGATVFSAHPLADVVPRATGSDAEIHRCEGDDTGYMWVVELSRRWGTSRWRRQERGKTLWVQSSAPHVYHVFGTGDAPFWSDVVLRLLKRGYPALSRGSLTTDEFSGLLRRLAAALGINPESFRIRDRTYRSRLVDRRASTQYESDRRWTDRDLDDVLGEVRDLDASLERVRFEARRGTSFLCKGSLTRTLEFTIAGEAAEFFSCIIDGSAELIGQRFEQLSKRERQACEGFEVRPFFIEYSHPVLDDGESRKRLVRALLQMKRASSSVIHDNPYVHVSLVDYAEDTNCDIFVVSSSRILVAPQTRSTPTSLERLFTHICNEFGEGIVRDFSEVYPE